MGKRNRRLYRLSSVVVGAITLCLLAGCGTASKRSKGTARHTGDAIAAAARTTLGIPYRYGGHDLNGFDCSGLALYTHQAVGLRIPRTTRDQYKHAQNVALKKLQPGDLVFFQIGWWRKTFHVGIYTGDGRFIHAPANGKKVSLERLDSPYWQGRIRKAGRYY